MARLSKQELYDSVPVGFKYKMPNGKVIEKRVDGVYIDDKPIEPGPFYGCETPTDYRRRAAEMTNVHRKAATAARIRAAQAEILASGAKPTVTGIARLARVSRQAIYQNHADLVK